MIFVGTDGEIRTSVNSMKPGAPYGWLIYESYIEDGCYHYPSEVRTPETVEVVGPCGCSDENEALLKAGKGTEFELYDDDRILYYKGRLIGDFDGLEPCDDYGMPNAGAVHTKIDGEWV